MLLCYNYEEVIIMNSKTRIIELLELKGFYTTELNELIYGSIEIRNNNYIYVHYKEEGLSKTKYVGEYSDELYSLIVMNNIKSRELKKEIRKIEKELLKLDYHDDELNKDVALNIDFAKKNLVRTIYKQAVLEGISTTLLEIENIINGGIVNNMTANDILKVINLKHAWEFILNKNVIQMKTNFVILCTINKLIEEGFYYAAGSLRSIPVKIGGTSWTPSIPYEADIKEDIDKIINNDKSNLEKSIDLLLYVSRKQMFIDGNKRTAVIFANHYLISKGEGLIVIPENMVEEYKSLLINYYESNNDSKIKAFLLNKCYTKCKESI